MSGEGDIMVICRNDNLNEAWIEAWIGTLTLCS